MLVSENGNVYWSKCSFIDFGCLPLISDEGETEAVACNLPGCSQ